MRIEMNARILGANAKIVTEGPLLAVVPRETHLGMMHQIELFLVVYSDEQDQTEVHPVAWPVARALAPGLLEQLSARISEVRAAAAG